MQPQYVDSVVLTSSICAHCQLYWGICRCCTFPSACENACIWTVPPASICVDYVLYHMLHLDRAVHLCRQACFLIDCLFVCLGAAVPIFADLLGACSPFIGYAVSVCRCTSRRALLYSSVRKAGSLKPSFKPYSL